MIELLAALFGIGSAYLAARKNIHTWTLSILSCLLYLIVFVQAQLLFSVVLNVYFIIVSVIGLMLWGFITEKHPNISVIVFWPSFVALSIVPLYLIEQLHMDWLNPTDFVIFVGSVIATGLLLIKHKWTWFVWIAVNCISIVHYYNEQLFWTSLQYSVFLINAMYGYAFWKDNEIKPHTTTQ